LETKIGKILKKFGRMQNILRNILKIFMKISGPFGPFIKIEKLLIFFFWLFLSWKLNFEFFYVNIIFLKLNAFPFQDKYFTKKRKKKVTKKISVFDHIFFAKIWEYNLLLKPDIEKWLFSREVQNFGTRKKKLKKNSFRF